MNTDQATSAIAEPVTDDDLALLEAALLESRLVVKSNPNHEPAGSPEGGQFAERPSGGPTQELQEGRFKSISARWAKANLSPNRDISHGEKKTIAGYSTLGSDWINRELRESQGKFDRNLTFSVPDPLSEDEHETQDIQMKMNSAVKNLDRVIDDTSVPQDISAYRSEGYGPPPGMKIGMTFTDYGYVSTSVNSGKSSNRREITIEIPRGAKALALESIGLGINDEEEVLLPRGTRFQVTRITKTGWTARVLT